jgi:hypothetical protein
MMKRVGMKEHGMEKINAFGVTRLFRGGGALGWIHPFLHLGSKGLKVSLHVFIDDFHFGIDGVLYCGFDSGIEGRNIGNELFNFILVLGYLS